MNEEARKLRTWIEPKEVKIREAKESVETQVLYIKQLNENISSGFYPKQKRMEIKEQQTEAAVKLKELELELLEKKLEMNFFEKQANIVMEDLKIQLEMEEQGLKDLHKRIQMAERNHKKAETEEKKKEEEKNETN